jgi:hypothetical protein
MPGMSQLTPQRRRLRKSSSLFVSWQDRLQNAFKSHLED